MDKNTTPYTTESGLQIGIFYERRTYAEMNYDMELIQSAYLNDADYMRKEKIKRIAYAAFVIAFIGAMMLVTKN